jgi:hypothetical protein
MIILFEKYKKSKFDVDDIVITDYFHDNELGIYKITKIQSAQTGDNFYFVFDIINNENISGWFLESDLRLAKQYEIDKAEILKKSKNYNL